MILKNCTFYNDEFQIEKGDIKVENGIFSQIGLLDGDGIDMTGKTLLPGFVDVHIHGGNGADCCDGNASALNDISKYLAKNGVTSFCPTTMTLPLDKLCNIVSNISNSQVNGAKIAGINLEGPFIAMSKRGAQNGDYVVDGSIDAFDELYSASNQTVKLITIAPEAFDSEKFIKYVSKKAVVSIGHTAADAKQTQKAIDMGAKHITHLFNAMTPMTHRQAGVVGTAFDNDVMCELICDGEHICPAVLRNSFKILGEDRAVVISDSMRGAGLGTGEFELGGQTTFVKEGYKVAKLADGTIAASITNVFEEFKNLLNFGVDFKAALKACSINPARAIGAESEIGSIALGKQADFIVVDENLEIKEVYINGKIA